MSEFDAFSDTAFQLKTEGEKITLTFKQGVPATGQGTVSWNIPTPAHGCTTENQAYGGMVILLGTEPMSAANIPRDGTVYHADSTASTDLHVGDRIGNALVVGAIYECEKKGAGEQLTTSFVVSDLQPNTPYYVAGYAVDCQYRYHSDGTRAYSDSYGNQDDPDYPARQIINISADRSTCIIPTDGTGLVAGTEYQFDVIVDTTYPTGTNVKTARITIDGIDAGTYQQLVDRINTQLKLIDNPPQSPLAPNSGAFYWNASEQTLYQFDGTTHNAIDAVVEATDPATVASGDYWYDTTNELLYRWDIPNAGVWNNIPFSALSFDPTSPIDNTYWFDQTTARMWNGINWCDQTTLLSTTDPAACPTMAAGMWWYDESTSVLYEWNTVTQRWEERSAIYWDEAPNALSSGTYWFDLATSKLYIRTIAAWADITADSYVQETTPIAPSDLALWYVPSTEELKQYNAGTSTWVTISVLVWSGDPTAVGSCDSWWRSTDEVLFIWDQLNSEWDQVINFSISSIDPSDAPIIAINTVWYNSSTNELKNYDGGDWVTISEFISAATDPTAQVDGNGWYNTTTNTWSIWGTPVAAQWNTVDPIDSANDPTSIPTGVYWFDTTNNVLYVRNGITWANVTYSTSQLTATRNSMWFDSSNEILYTWDGTAWVEAEPVAFAYFNNCGITFETTQRGSNTVIIVPAPANSQSSAVCIGSGYADLADAGLLSQDTTCSYAGTNGTVGYTARVIPTEIFLWDNLTLLAGVAWPQEGADGKLGSASYDVRGAGDDGTPDERRELMDSIRQQLGYPVVEVELTQYQLDTAVQGALESFRKRSSMAYQRGFYFLDIQPQQQNYLMTNRRIGYHKIVDISSAHRFTSAFMSTAHGGGVYGQVALQHLYNMGTYDLTSYHLVAQYIEQLEHLFATRLVFNWNEEERMLSFFQSFTRHERVLLDCSVERTEQELLKDRFAKSWIERYALAESMTMLAQIRGKYGSLPGAGGGVTLNASELMATADSYRAELLQQLDDYVVQGPEDFGMGSTFIIG